MNPTRFALSLLLVLSIIAVLDYFRTANSYIKEYNEDNELESISTKFSKTGFGVWYRVKAHWWTRRYHFAQSVLNRFVGSHPEIARGIIGICPAAIVFHYAPNSKYVAAATVFYATMIFVNNQFEYAVLCPTKTTINRFENEEVMDTVTGSTTVLNRGTSSAENIQARMEVIDPIRGFSSEVSPHLESREEYPNSILPSHEGEYEFMLANNDNKFRNMVSRVSFNNRLGNCPTACIIISSPDMACATRIYTDLPEEAQNIDELLESVSDIADSFDVSEKYKV